MSEDSNHTALKIAAAVLGTAAVVGAVGAAAYYGSQKGLQASIDRWDKEAYELIPVEDH